MRTVHLQTAVHHKTVLSIAGNILAHLLDHHVFRTIPNTQLTNPEVRVYSIILDFFLRAEHREIVEAQDFKSGRLGMCRAGECRYERFGDHLFVLWQL